MNTATGNKQLSSTARPLDLPERFATSSKTSLGTLSDRWDRLDISQALTTQISGSKTPDEIKYAFVPQAEGLIQGGVDALLIETSQDILEVKMAIEACHDAMKTSSITVPIIANITLDQYGKMLLGTPVQAAYTTVSNMGIDVFGLNCSTGPTEMMPSIRWLNEQEELPILVVPNAGMPLNEGGKAIYKMSPSEMADRIEDFITRFDRVRIIGGCCGTDANHIYELRKMLERQEK